MCVLKDTIEKLKDNTQQGRIFEDHVSDKGLVLRI